MVNRGPLFATGGSTSHATIEALEAEFTAARKAGCARAREELEVGLRWWPRRSMTSSGHVAAALSVSRPAYRMRASYFVDVVRQTITAADAVSWGLVELRLVVAAIFRRASRVRLRGSDSRMPYGR